MVAGLIYIVNRPILVGLLGLICGMFYFYGWVLRKEKKRLILGENLTFAVA